MKSQTEILNLLRRYKPTAQKKYGLTRIGIFGSVARVTTGSGHFVTVTKYPDPDVT